MRILLVEDDRMIGSATAQALKDSAYAVDWVTDGQSAQQSCSLENYDLMLLDLGLSGADGFDVLTYVRRQGKKLPVIIVTARDAIDDRVRGLDLGADDYLIKPF